MSGKICELCTVIEMKKVRNVSIVSCQVSGKIYGMMLNFSKINKVANVGNVRCRARYVKLCTIIEIRKVRNVSIVS